MKPELTNKLEILLWQQVLKRVLVAFSILLLFIITIAYLVPLETKSYDGHIVTSPIPSGYSIIAELLRLVPTQNNIQHRTFLPSRLRYYCEAITTNNKSIIGRCLKDSKTSPEVMVTIQEQSKLFGLFTEYYIYPNNSSNLTGAQNAPSS